MVETARLNLPLIAPEQALKHITHNEAVQALDTLVHLVVEELGRNDPPAAPIAGQSYDIGVAPTGDWTGRAGQLAAWTDGGWRFLLPDEGWLAWDKNTGTAYVHAGSGWVALADGLGPLQNMGLLGVNTVADTTNRLAVRSNAVLLTALENAAGGNGDARLSLNRESGADTASMVFQTGYSARAEIGLAGADDFSVKVSPDGTVFHTGMTIDKDSGFITLNQMFGAEPSFPVVSSGVLAVSTSYIVPTPETGVADTIDTITGGFDGALLVVTGTAGITLTFANGTGNLKLGTARVLDGFEDSLMLVKRGADWIEISYADNA